MDRPAYATDGNTEGMQIKTFTRKVIASFPNETIFLKYYSPT